MDNYRRSVADRPVCPFCDKHVEAVGVHHPVCPALQPQRDRRAAQLSHWLRSDVMDIPEELL